ncbi:MAG: type II toxin-antitoxin system HicA family toxin [bacterium]|nr:type II toxin-antitoxin system HicA family toxin [bacterium]
MAKIAPISYKKLVRIFELEGFRHRSTKGDHLIYTKVGISRPIVVPKYEEIPVFVIKNNLKSAGITRERYFELLKRP